MCDICKAAAATATRRTVLGTGLAAGLAAGTGLGLGGSPARAQEAGEPPVGTGEHGRRILIRGGHVLSMDDAVGDFEGGDILVEGGRIVEVAQSIDAPDAEIVDAEGRIVMPGFVDTHHHLFETALRSWLAEGLLADDGTPEGQPNYLEHILGRFAPVYRPEDVLINILFGRLSQLDAGVTTVLDISQIHHSPEHTDAAIQALRDGGGRAVFGYFEGQGDRALYPADARRIREEHFASDDDLLTMLMGGEIYLPGWEEAWAIADELDLPLAYHVVGALGMIETMETLAREGRFRPNHTLIHMTDMPRGVWEAVRDASAHVSLAVPIEMTMRHGTPPILEALEMGIAPSLSSDVECTMTADFFTQMRSTFTLQRMLVNAMALEGREDRPPLLTTRETIRFATAAGAEGLGLADRTGTLTPGKEADLLLLDARVINVAPLNNVTGAVVTLMERSNVEAVMVAGRFRKWGGRLLDADVDGLRSRLEASRDHLFEAADIERRLFDR
jgi:5-methylthioadenosine/S-adenosylhomocysteine deaminase